MSPAGGTFQAPSTHAAPAPRGRVARARRRPSSPQPPHAATARQVAWETADVTSLNAATRAEESLQTVTPRPASAGDAAPSTDDDDDSTAHVRFASIPLVQQQAANGAGPR